MREKFKNHVATLMDYGNIKIIDFKNPESMDYRIRFIFEEDYYRLHISGDLGELTATNYKNMCYEQFSDFIHNTGYFEGKIDCMSRAIYYYDLEKAREDLRKELDWYDLKEPELEDILDDLNEKSGLGTRAYEILSEIDSECYEWIADIGKEETGILEVYMLAFELAQKQLCSQYNSFKCINSFSMVNSKFIQVLKNSVWEKEEGDGELIRLSNNGEKIEIDEDFLIENFTPLRKGD